MAHTNIPLLQAACYRPWVVHKPALGAVLEIARMRSEAIAQMSIIDIEAAVQAASSAPLGRMIGAIAVIPVRGFITQKSDLYSWYFGGTSVERLTSTFRAYLNDPAVSTIVLDVDSPGGEAFGVPEFFEEIFAARGQKTLIAISNPFMASAAYWLGCACDEVYLAPSGQAGSVGCYVMHEDVSKMLAQVGIDITFIQYGEHKTEGNSYEPLSASAKEDWQANVDFYGQWFDKAVAKARNVSPGDVKARFGQGRVFRAPDAKKIGMVDKIGTLDDVLARFSPKRVRGMVAAAEGGYVAPNTIAVEWLEHLAAMDVVPVAAAADVVTPNADGTCPDGYEKDDDGQCRMVTEDGDAEAAADADAVAVTLAMLEG